MFLFWQIIVPPAIPTPADRADFGRWATTRRRHHAVPTSNVSSTWWTMSQVWGDAVGVINTWLDALLMCTLYRTVREVWARHRFSSELTRAKPRVKDLYLRSSHGVIYIGDIMLRWSMSRSDVSESDEYTRTRDSSSLFGHRSRTRWKPRTARATVATDDMSRSDGIAWVTSDWERDIENGTCLWRWVCRSLNVVIKYVVMSSIRNLLLKA